MLLQNTVTTVKTVGSEGPSGKTSGALMLA